MSFLTEYFDEYRIQPIRKTTIFWVGSVSGRIMDASSALWMLRRLTRRFLDLADLGDTTSHLSTLRDYCLQCRPEHRWAVLEGKWLDPKVGTEDKVLTEEEIEAFIKTTMRRLRGQSTYYNDYCGHLDPKFKTRKFKPQPKKKRPCKDLDKPEEEAYTPPPAAKLAMKDTELMKVARDLYERDMDKPTLEPLKTHFRVLGFVRPCLWKTGLSDYQGSIARLAYEMIRDDRIPRYHAHNGCRPRWGLPPEGTRQPELDGAPYDGERLY